ncbi:MAG TPA: MFS transporter [Thermomicrobiales bacterium]|nr:MFS transporter [Thermomicrobiales bacterium]
MWSVNVLLLTPVLKSIAADFSTSDAVVGQLATLHALATCVTALLITPWIDRFGRGRLLRLGAGLLLAGSICLALAPTFVWMFPARLMAGVGAAFIMPVCLAAAGDLFPDPRKRNQVVGLILAATALAFVIGLPILAQIDAAFGWRWAVAALIVPTIAIGGGSLWLPTQVIAPATFSVHDYARHYRHVLGNWETDWLLAGHVVRGVAWYSALVYLGAYAVTSYGFDANRLSLLFVVIGGVFFVATNVMPLMTRLISPRQLFVASIVVLFVNFMCAGLIDDQWGMFLFVIVLSMAGAGMTVAESVLLLDSFPSARGGIMSLRSAGSEVSLAIGAAVAGLLLVLTNDYSTMYRLLGLALPLAVLTLALSRRKRREPEVAPLSPGTGEAPAS